MKPAHRRNLLKSLEPEKNFLDSLEREGGGGRGEGGEEGGQKTSQGRKTILESSNRFLGERL